MSEIKKPKLTGKANSGKARAESLTLERRKEISQKGVAAKKELALLPKAKYEGKLKIGDVDLDVAVLENNQRIITLTAAFKAFDRPVRGNPRLINIPVFMDAKNLQPFVDKDLMAVINKVQYVNMGGKIQEGYDVLIIPMVSDLYLKARSENKLVPAQEDTAKKAEILIRSLAKVGIVALVDEATGYQDARAKDALAQILEKFVAKELQPWVKTFPLDCYKELCRLYGVPFPPPNGNFPQFFGHVTNNAIYSRLAPELLPELKKAASKQERKAKLHQSLTSEVGHPKLREHLASIVTLLKISKKKDDFLPMVDMIHPKFNENFALDFGSIEG